ncbi:MAG: dihydroorotate dehydrogenase [Methanoculleaceae archaeon]
MLQLLPGPLQVGGVTIRNHLLLAAGILGTTGSSLRRVLEHGAGGVVTKSIGPGPSSGHPGPALVVVEGGLLNAMGLPNPGPEFVRELQPLAGQPVIVSIYGGTPEEFSRVASWFAGMAAGIELNLSCPHAEGYGLALGRDPDLVEECTRAVARYDLPVWVKLTPNVGDITEIGQAAERGGADALVAINTLRAMRISTELRRPVLGNRFGGLSGPAIFPLAVRCVYELYEACSCPIIACGGISTARDVVEMMMAGASAVEIGSAVHRYGIDVFSRITSELYSDDGVDPDEVVGSAHE